MQHINSQKTKTTKKWKRKRKYASNISQTFTANNLESNFKTYFLLKKEIANSLFCISSLRFAMKRQRQRERDEKYI